jgi:hypothetical protein
MKEIKGKCFLTIGKTQESTEAQEGFKRYIGYANSYVVAVNPSKAELEKIYGRELEKEPEYVGEDEQGKYVRIDFIVKTDPNEGANPKKNIPGHGIEIINHAMITLRPTPATNQEGDQVTVFDRYGNYARMLKADADAHKKPVSVNGKDLRVDTDYKIACVGQDLLLHFLKTYLGMGCGFDYKNGVWVKKDNAADDEFVLEKIKNYFTGDVSEIREAIAFQPNNKIKLLYGVKTKEDGKQQQVVCTKGEMVLSNAANANALAKLEKDLVNAKQNGAFQNIDYRIQELQEWSVEPTNLEKPAQNSDLPFDANPSSDGILDNWG